MNIKIKFVVDKSSLDDVEKDLHEILSRQLKQELKDFRYEFPNKNKLNNLIDLLIEKRIIERSDVI